MLWPPGIPLPVTSRGALAPNREHVVDLVHRAAVGPEHVERAADLAIDVGGVVLKVDRGARAIVFAHPVHAFGGPVRAVVLGLSTGRRRARLPLREQLVLG